MILTFELVNEEEKELEIFFDEEGLELLLAKLQLLKDRKAPIHDHLMTSNWGDGELTNEIQGDGNLLINKVSFGKRGPALFK